MIYDVSDPSAAVFQSYVNRRDFTEPNTIEVNGDEITNPNVGDLAVEGLKFIPASESPNGNPLLVTANEVSGTTTIFEITDEPVMAAAALPAVDPVITEPEDNASHEAAFTSVEAILRPSSIRRVPHRGPLAFDSALSRRSTWHRVVDNVLAQHAKSEQDSRGPEELSNILDALAVNRRFLI